MATSSAAPPDAKPQRDQGHSQHEPPESRRQDHGEQHDQTRCDGDPRGYAGSIGTFSQKASPRSASLLHDTLTGGYCYAYFNSQSFSLAACS